MNCLPRFAVMSRSSTSPRFHSRLAIYLTLSFAVFLACVEQARAQCVAFPVQTNQTCTNSITLTDTSVTAFGNAGLQDLAKLTLTNTQTGFISATGVAGTAIYANAANVTNYGTIAATVNPNNSVGIVAATGDAIVANYGTILVTGLKPIAIVSLAGNVNLTNSGQITANSGSLSPQFTIFAANDANIVNSGTIAGLGQNAGIGAGNNLVLSNSGTIIADGIFAVQANSLSVANSGLISANGLAGIGIFAGTTGNVTTSGTIIGTRAAIAFHANGGSGGDVLNVLPGAQFGGVVDFHYNSGAGGIGGADTVTLGAGSWIVNTANFNAALSTVTAGGNPFVVTANQIVAADLSGFGAQNRAIMDITGWIASVLPDAPVFAPGPTGGVHAFAATDTAANPFAAFASFPSDASDASNAMGYTKAPAFKAASVAYANGQAVWAKGFGGQRQQDTNGAFIGSTTTGYGGAVGYERMVMPDLKLGALIGGSTNKTNLYLNAGSTSTDTVFGGAYGRKTWGGTFLDLAVIGGNLDNRNVRNIGGGLAFVTANASYGGWFVMPSMMLGQRIDINHSGFTITPAVRVRYVAASFDGYTETGAGIANLTVAGHSFGAWDERAEVTFANTATLSSGDRITARITGGILGQQRSTGGQINVALIGQNFLATTPDRSSVAGSYGSAGLDWQIGKVTLFAAGEATYTNDVARIYAGKGGVKVSW